MMMMILILYPQDSHFYLKKGKGLSCELLKESEWWFDGGGGLDVDWMEVAITYNIGHVRHYHHQPAIILCQAMQHGKMLMRCDDIGIITLLMVFCIACQKRQSCRQHHRSHTPIRRYYNDTAILTMSNEQRHTLT